MPLTFDMLQRLPTEAETKVSFGSSNVYGPQVGLTF
jgi:hypothetical protein